MSEGQNQNELAKQIDAARTMLATELVAKMLELSPVALSSESVVGFILTKEVAWELVKVAECISREECRCIGHTKKERACKHALAEAFNDRLYQWLTALDEMKKSKIIRVK